MKLDTLLLEEFLLEFRNNLPDTNYGYWITNKGEFIPVPTHKHHEIAARELQLPGSLSMSSEQALDAASDRGWMRVILNPDRPKDLKAQPSPKSPPIAFQALYNLVRTFGKHVNEIDLHVRGTQEFYRGDNVGKALAWINANRGA